MGRRGHALVVVAVLGLGTRAFAGGALDKPFGAASGADMLAAAKAAPGGTDAIVLREDSEKSFDEAGLGRTRWRMVTYIRSQAVADDYREVKASWHTLYQSKPAIRARVIKPSGAVVDVDPKLAAEEPAQHAGDLMNDLVLPLPRIEAGSILEQEVVYVDSAPLPVGTYRQVAVIGNGDPTLATRITMTAPAKLKAHVVPRGVTVKPKLTTANGIQTWVFDIGALPATPRREEMLPPDAAPPPQIAMTGVASWSALARGYVKLVDKALADGAVTLPASLPKGSGLDVVRAIAQHVKTVHSYRAMSFYLTSMAPPLPSDVVKRDGGDSRDLAVLLVAMLRQAGVRADLALVDGGTGVDIDRDVPSLDVFDTVLVRAVVDGKPVWIDLEEMYAPAGQLGWYVQGRRALVIANDTTDLVVTPMASSGDNVMREERTYKVLENGNGEVTEVERPTGVFAIDQRDWMAGNPAEIRKGLAKYTSEEFNGEFVEYTSTAAPDLTVPLEVTITARRSGRAYTNRERIDVELRPFDVFDRLPDVLLDEQPADAPPRTSDLWMSRPHRHVVESRFVVPPGFQLPTPAPRKQRAIGRLTFTETQKLDGRTFVVTYELDSGPPRMSPADVIATQKAIDAFYKEGSQHINLDNIGTSLLLAGKVKEAIAEFERVAKLHPSEAVHQDELARAYLSVGAGAAARRAARKAVALEPKLADAYVVLGWVLGHDEIGRRFTGSFDRAGARAALEKARTLDPKHAGAFNELGQLLERDTRGSRFESGADLVTAAASYKAAYALDNEPETAYSAARAYLWAGKGAEAETLLKPLARGQTRDILYLTSVALTRGPAEAIQTASTMASGADRTKLIGDTASMLFLVRSYDACRALFAEAKTIAAGTKQADMVARLQKHSFSARPIKTPADVVYELVQTEFAPDRVAKIYWDKTVRADVEGLTSVGFTRLPKDRDTMTDSLLADVTLAMMTPAVEGDDKAWRLTFDAGVTKLYIYLAADRGVPKIVGVDQAMKGVGRHLLRLLAKDDEKPVLRVLDWLDADRSSLKGTLAGSLFSFVWGGKIPRTHAAMELAAAVLAADSAPDRVIPIVDHCSSTTTDGQWACDMILAHALTTQKRWAELEAHAQTWAGRAKYPSLPRAMRAGALVQLGKLDDAEQVLADVLASEPDNIFALKGRVEVALARGNISDGIKRFEPLLKRQTAMDLNNLAWLELADRSDLASAKAHSEKAVSLDPNVSNSLHTLASIEAEMGELGSAWNHALQSLGLTRDPQQLESIYYVQGRVLEQLGLMDEAIAAYRKVKPHPSSMAGFPDSAMFAAVRLKALGAKP